MTQQNNVALLWVWYQLLHSHEAIDFYTRTAYEENATKRVQDRRIQ
jgi:hypothetical protein